MQTFTGCPESALAWCASLRRCLPLCLLVYMQIQCKLTLMCIVSAQKRGAVVQRHLLLGACLYKTWHSLKRTIFAGHG